MSEIRLPLSSATAAVAPFGLGRRDAPGAFSTVVASGAEAEGFNDAFFRFLELNCRSWAEFEERSCGLESTPMGAYEHKLVRFWSDEAAQLFVLFWRGRGAAAAPAPGGFARASKPGPSAG